MGYGIVLSSDDAALRAAAAVSDPAQRERAVTAVGADLAAALGTDGYPAAGVAELVVGAWQRAGAWASGHRVLLTLDRRGLHPSASPAQVHPAGAHWQGTLTGGQQHRATIDLLTNPARAEQLAARARAGGPDLRTALFGADASATSIRSVWWFHADALTLAGPLDPLALGQAALDLLGDRYRTSAQVGSHLGALNRAGYLTAAGDEDKVSVEWSGNWVHLPEPAIVR